ncbi:MAG TPA: diacylglycerol kinase family protein, partial [Coriobacteriia bacterium]|nr:diacylglycerol kinase family protein [Coriobacteriia bacterium]
GGGDAGLYDFVRFLGLEGVEVVLRFATAERRAEELLRDAQGFDRIVAAGGDGTVSAVCYATRSTGVPVLVYPTGTANLLALNLRMPTDPPALSQVLLRGEAVGFDLCELEMTGSNGAPSRSGFTIMAGAGYDATIMHGAEALKSTFGAAAYLLSAVTNLTPTSARFSLVLDGEPVEEEGIAVLLANFARIQFDLPITPGSDPRDGILEIAVLKTKTVVGLLPAITAAVLDRVGDHPDRSPSVALYSAATVEVRSDPPLRMQCDGDALASLTPFTARVLPRAATLLVPAASEYAAAATTREGVGGESPAA